MVLHFVLNDRNCIPQGLRKCMPGSDNVPEYLPQYITALLSFWSTLIQPPAQVRGFQQHRQHSAWLRKGALPRLATGSTCCEG